MKLTAALVFLIFLVGCGGNAVAPATGPSSPTPTPSGGGSTGPSSAAVVTVAAGQTASSIDIAVSGAAASPAPNAQNLGVADVTGPGSAANTGDQIHRGQVARVLLFGPGLAGDMQVTIRGPNDLGVTNIHSITSTTNTPGIAFTVAVAPDAALGARTVVLQSTKGDITTFTGGLEVVP